MYASKRPSARGDEQGNQRRFYRQSIELPIAIDVKGLPAHVYGTLVNISETGCRLRSLILIDRNRDVICELRRPATTALLLRGRIVSRATPPSGGGYDYGVSFTAMNGPERDALGSAIAELQRREALSRADLRAPMPRPKSGKQRRGSLRAFVSFRIRYRQAGKTASSLGEANDISTGGVRIISSTPLELGALAQLRFTLPATYLDVYPPSLERTEISPFGPRRVKLPDNRRPFEEMSVQGRVVSKFAPVRGHDVYGVQFTEIDGYQREEIARFTHSVQLSKLRAQ